jgi:hypothetical protein
MKNTMNTILRLVAFLALVLPGSCLVFGIETRTWKTSDGKFSVEAEFIDATQTEVTLRRSDNGKVVKVPIHKLSDADREWVNKNQVASRKTPTSSDSIQKIDDEHILFAPYGPVLIPSPDIEWKKQPGETPTIVALTGTLLQPEKKESLSDRLMVSVFNPVPENEREKFFEQIVKSAVADLVDIGYQESEIKPGKANQFKTFADQYFFSIKTVSRKTEACTYVCVHFQASRTILVQTRLASKTRENRYSSAADMTQKIFDQIARDTSWNPPQQIPESVKMEILELKKQALSLLEAKDYVTLLNNLLPIKDLEQIKASGSSMESIAEDFERRDLKEFRENFENLKWENATYDATNERLAFRGTKVVLVKVDGKWRFQ